MLSRNFIKETDLARLTSIVFLPLIGCTTDGESPLGSLEYVLKNKEVVRNNVIACAASNGNDGSTIVYFYPREGVSNCIKKGHQKAFYKFPYRFWDILFNLRP